MNICESIHRYSKNYNFHQQRSTYLGTYMCLVNRLISKIIPPIARREGESESIYISRKHPIFLFFIVL